MSAATDTTVALVLPAGWVDVARRAPVLADTMTAYLGRLGERLAPRSVDAAEVCLRQFALHVVSADASCRSVCQITTGHVAAWEAALAQRRGWSGEPAVSPQVIAYKVATLRRFFQQITAWGWPDAPAELPVTRPPSPPRPPRVRPGPPPIRVAKPAKGKPVASARPKPPSRALPRETTWQEIATRAPHMAATMAAYLEQLSVSHRPSSVEAASLALRHLAAHVTASDPTCVGVAGITRAHIEAYKLALAARRGRSGALSTTTIRHNLGMVRTFFERIDDWDWPDAPRRIPVFAGDIPKADEPLPKFLDDPTAAKFMATVTVDPDRRRRLLVELLARTGMRAGELGGLRDDAMYRVGDTWWLRIPVGKLHNDRNVPLHPLLVGLIADYQAGRGPSRHGFLLERDDGRPFDRRTIYRYVATVARHAGIGRVHPHQLRHTLATQCQMSTVSADASFGGPRDRSPVWRLGSLVTPVVC